jgi:hypothetical protein
MRINKSCLACCHVVYVAVNCIRACLRTLQCSVDDPHSQRDVFPAFVAYSVTMAAWANVIISIHIYIEYQFLCNKMKSCLAHLFVVSRLWIATYFRGWHTRGTALMECDKKTAFGLLLACYTLHPWISLLANVFWHNLQICVCHQMNSIVEMPTAV